MQLQKIFVNGERLKTTIEARHKDMEIVREVAIIHGLTVVYVI